MKKTFLVALLFVCCSEFGQTAWAQKRDFQRSTAQTATNVGLPGLQTAILAEMNRVRRDPPAYAKWIEENQKTFDWKPRKAAVREALRVLKSTAPLSELSFSGGLQRAASDIVRDQLPTGSFDHTGTDGSTIESRIKRYGALTGTPGENAMIFFTTDAAYLFVLGMVIDQDDPNRGHRKTILKPTFRLAGVGCGVYTVDGNLKGATLCVADFADAFRENSARAQNKNGRR